jgi:hypothetical protein
MPRSAIAVVLALAATAANAQGAPSGQSHAPAVTGPDGTQPATNANGTRPFLFDGRMKGDGVRRRAHVDNRHPNTGAIIVQPKASQPERE